MGAYIKGMKIPQPNSSDKADFYDAYILVSPNGHATIVVDSLDHTKEYSLIPVPEPHGRLIDAGRFDARLDRGKRTISSLPLPEDFIDMYALIADGVKEELSKCGTIIPEEGDPR